MVATLIVISVSLLFFIATEFFFPISGADHTAVKQRHFWSIMLTIISMSLGFLLKFQVETQQVVEKSQKDTQQSVEKVASAFQQISPPQMREKFEALSLSYQSKFLRARDPLLQWAAAALQQLDTDMSTGWISLQARRAPDQLGIVYGLSTKSIVATNVGGTRLYFSNQNYINSNRKAQANHVPVIRVYLYSRNKEVLYAQQGETEPQNVDEFFNRIVKTLHTRMGTMYSAVIDVDAKKPAHDWDVLISDNEFVAQTELSTAWEPIQARASEDEKNLREFRLFFHGLKGLIEERYVVKMTNDEMLRWFPQYKEANQQGKLAEGKLADGAFEEIMDQFAPLDSH